VVGSLYAVGMAGGGIVGREAKEYFDGLGRASIDSSVAERVVEAIGEMLMENKVFAA